MICVTSEGMDAADTSTFDDISIPTTNDEKHDAVKAELSAKQLQVFETIADGRSYDKEGVRTQLGMEKNSTWRNLLASLVKIKIVEYPDSTTIRLTEEMFPVVPRPE